MYKAIRLDCSLCKYFSSYITMRVVEQATPQEKVKEMVVIGMTVTWLYLVSVEKKLLVL